MVFVCDGCGKRIESRRGIPMQIGNTDTILVVPSSGDPAWKAGCVAGGKESGDDGTYPRVDACSESCLQKIMRAEGVSDLKRHDAGYPSREQPDGIAMHKSPTRWSAS